MNSGTAQMKNRENLNRSNIHMYMAFGAIISCISVKWDFKNCTASAWKVSKNWPTVKVIVMVLRVLWLWGWFKIGDATIRSKKISSEIFTLTCVSN